jgi:hypothetical protein
LWGLYSQRGGVAVRKAHLYSPWSIQLGRTAALYEFIFMALAALYPYVADLVVFES